MQQCCKNIVEIIWKMSIHCRIIVSIKRKQYKTIMETTQNGSQLDKVNAALLELYPNVTTSDRREAKKMFSETTIVQYLNGRGKDLDTAIELLQFFRTRISDRDQAIA